MIKTNVYCINLYYLLNCKFLIDWSKQLKFVILKSNYNMIKLIRYLQRVNTFKYILFGLVPILFASITISLLSNERPEVPFPNYGKLFLFFVAVLVSPFIETILFQALPLIIIKKFVKHKYKLWVYLSFSALIFMLFHPYNITYIIVTLVIGFIFAFFYYVATFRKEPAIILISIIHSIYNLIVFVLYVISESVS